jgi:hypothetical protein
MAFRLISDMLTSFYVPLMSLMAGEVCTNEELSICEEPSVIDDDEEEEEGNEKENEESSICEEPSVNKGEEKNEKKNEKSEQKEEEENEEPSIPASETHPENSKPYETEEDWMDNKPLMDGFVEICPEFDITNKRRWQHPPIGIFSRLTSNDQQAYSEQYWLALRFSCIDHMLRPCSDPAHRIKIAGMPREAINTTQGQVEWLLKRRTALLAGKVARGGTGSEWALNKNDVILDRYVEAICRDLEGYRAEDYELVILVFGSVFASLLLSSIIWTLGLTRALQIRSSTSDDDPPTSQSVEGLRESSDGS